MNLKSLKYFFFLMMAVITLSSCSEDDDNVSEYANWQERNEQAFADTLAYARKMGEANGWYVYKNWTFENQTPTNKDQNGLPYKDCDNIIVHVLKKGEGTTSPILTDSVQVSYRGRFIPTDNYKEGYVFDQSFTGTFDAATANPIRSVASGFIDGFTTALLKMHPGDYWQVFIPYQLAYGERAVILQSKAIQCSVLRWCSRVIRELLARSGLLNNKNKDLEKSMCICLK